jgi:CRISPR system Cascade subunit CasD
MNTLLVPLVGPMQSWGYRSRFDDRDTALEPTRSGVVGLLCAALGWPRDADLSPFDPLRMGVRVDKPGRVMIDYHTAMGVLRSDQSGTENAVSRRAYLADARFLVGLEGDDIEWLRRLEVALRSPVWPLYLGRKSFPLTHPPYFPQGSIRAGVPVRDALRTAPLLGHEKIMRVVLEAEPGEGGAAVGDLPLDFAGRRFGLRTIVQDFVEAAQEAS